MAAGCMTTSAGDTTGMNQVTKASWWIQLIAPTATSHRKCVRMSVSELAPAIGVEEDVEHQGTGMV